MRFTSLILFCCLSCISNAESYLKSHIKAADASSYNADTTNLTLRGMLNQAITLGEQGGRYETFKLLEQYLESKSEVLSENFNFSILMMEKNGFLIMPPNIQKVDGRVVVTDKIIRSAKHTYEIKSDPKFVSAVPTWRDYITFNAEAPEITRRNILPTTDYEKELWKEKVDEGWRLGVESAYISYERRLRRFVATFQGYIYYYIMLDHNKVTEPKFVANEYAVTGGGQRMNEDEVLLKIDVNPQLNGNRDQWRPIPQLPAIEDILSPDLKESLWRR